MTWRCKVMPRQQFHDYNYNKPYKFSRYSSPSHRIEPIREWDNEYVVKMTDAGCYEHIQYVLACLPVRFISDTTFRCPGPQGWNYNPVSAVIQDDAIHIWRCHSFSGFAFKGGCVLSISPRHIGDVLRPTHFASFTMSHFTPRNTSDSKPLSKLVGINRKRKGKSRNWLKRIEESYLTYINSR